jgi:hypothetical protein
MRSIEPGIHRTASSVDEWIPGSCFARPGMTTDILSESHVHDVTITREAPNYPGEV